jgi:hypothetical protein
MFRSFKTSLVATILLASSNPLLAGGHGSMGGGAGHGSMGGSIGHGSMGASLSHAAIRSAPSMGISRSLSPQQGPVNLRQLNGSLGGNSAGGGLSTRSLTLTNNQQSGISSAGSSNGHPPVPPPHTSTPTVPSAAVPVPGLPINDVLSPANPLRGRQPGQSPRIDTTGGGSTGSGSGSDPTVPPPHASTPSVPSVGTTPHLNLNDVISPANPVRGRQPGQSPPTGGTTGGGTQPISLVGVGVPDINPITDNLGLNPGSAPPTMTPPPRNGRGPRPGNGDNGAPGTPPPGRGGRHHPGDGGSVVVGIGIGGGISFPGETVGYTETIVTTSSPAAEPAAASIDLGEVKNAAAPSLDIELVDVRLVDAGSMEHGVGPRFRLFCRNNGTLEAPKFHVTVMADLGSTLTEKAHQVTVESVGIKPGKTQTVDIQMPLEILKMTSSKDRWARPFDLLGAMLDSDESLTETNEKNNTLVLARDSIKPLGAE